MKGEAFLDMALNETPLDQVDFVGNFEDQPINGEQLPQNQNILGNHQYLNNIGNYLKKSFCFYIITTNSIMYLTIN